MKMKTLTTFITLLLFIGTLHAQKKTPDLSIGTISEEEMDRGLKAISNIMYNNSKLKGPIKLNDYYKANDGSIVSVRQIGDKVYAIADRYDRRFSSLWVGTFKNGLLKVKYFYIPKGEAKGSGTLTFKVNRYGRAQKLVLQKNSINNFNFKSMTTIPQLPTKIPIDDRAWYRGDTRDNLTGRYRVANMGKFYMLDLGKQVIGYSAGSRPTTHRRPSYTALFIGEKTSTSIKGFYIDLPLGYTLGGGETAFDIIGQHSLRTNRNYFYYGFEHKRALDDKKEILK